MKTTVAVLVIVVLGAVGVGIYLLWPRDRDNNTPRDGGTKIATDSGDKKEPRKKEDPPKKDQTVKAGETPIDASVEEAYLLQKDRKWCEAEAKWDAVLTQLGKMEKSPDNEQRRREAEGNRDMLRVLCKPAQAPVEKIKRDPPKEERPERVSKETLLKFYPEGGQVVSRGIVRIRGQGVNADWAIKAERHFTYRSQIETKSRVLENNGETAVFEVRFGRVQQSSTWTTARVELDLPNDPIANIVFDQIAKKYPLFRLVKTSGDIVKIVDPNLRGTLTSLSQQLERAGLVGNDRSEIAVKISELEGKTVRITYANGVGVTGVDVVGDVLPPDLLHDLADRAAPLMDAFVFEAVEKKEGERTKIRARDIAGLFPFGRDGVATGWVWLRREKDEVPGKIGRIRVEDSEVTIEGKRTAAEERGQLFVESGTVRYSLDDLFVVSAKMQLTVKTLFRSRDHLLFRAQNLRNVETDVTYHAELVAP